MASFFETDELKDKLIIAGINEIETHGLEDFSLRRVAYACGVSCAAPYKHFKNREGLIIEILDFYNRQWKLLEEQIIQIHADDLKKLILELSMANIKFRIANPSFRFLFTLNKEAFNVAKEKELHSMNGKIEEFMRLFCMEKAYDKKLIDSKVMSLNAYIFGITMLPEVQEALDKPEVFEMIRGNIEKELE